MHTITKLASIGTTAANGVKTWLRGRSRPASVPAHDPGEPRVAPEAYTADLATLLQDDVGMTSRQFDDVDRIYAGAQSDNLATPMADASEPSVEEAEEGYRGAEEGESWMDVLGAESAEDGPESEDVDIAVTSELPALSVTHH